jgi:hypothetical protein
MTYLTLELQLNMLQAARDLLAATYIQWVSHTPDGRHCAVGVLDVLGLYNSRCPVFQRLEATARSLYPEYEGASAWRAVREESKGPEEGPLFKDYFLRDPLVYVNNHLGKEATLAVFDSAILELEIQLAQKNEPLVRSDSTVEKIRERGGRSRRGVMSCITSKP